MIKVVNLRKEYGDIVSVNDINFEIKEGEIVGLLGANGAGKSTTMKMLTGFLSPTRGEIEIFGENMLSSPKKAKQNIGYLPEIPPLYFDMTVEEQLKFVCSLKGVDKDLISAEISRACTYLNLENVKGRLIRSLSKGYKQRVGFACAIIKSPKLLILDEPTVGLDPQQIIDIRSLILKLSKHMTVVISSHILAEIASICSRIIIMGNGNILADGSKEQLENMYSDKRIIEAVIKGNEDKTRDIALKIDGVCTLKVFEGLEKNTLKIEIESKDKCDLREDIFKAFEGSGNSILELAEKSMSLENIFIELTKGNQ